VAWVSPDAVETLARAAAEQPFALHAWTVTEYVRPTRSLLIRALWAFAASRVVCPATFTR